jgi:hypothetical protein
MKKPVRYLAAIFCMAALSCNKDKNDDDGNKPPLPPAPPEVKPASTQVTVYNATLWSASLPYGAAESSASVKLYKTFDNYPDNPAYTGTTNANGEVVIDSIKPGEYYVVAEKEYMREKLSNVLFYIKGLGGYTADSLLQAASTATPAPMLNAAGNFMFKDLNMDGVINMNDRWEFPAQKIKIDSGLRATQKVLIGYLDNRIFKRLSSASDINLALTAAYLKVEAWHELQVTLDAVYTDDHDCTNLSAAWCGVNGYQITPTETTITRFWTDGYTLLTGFGNLLANVELSGLTDTEKKLITGQVKIMKAYVYQQMSLYYGGLPLQDYIVLKPTANRASQADMDAEIIALANAGIADLTAASATFERGKASIAAGKAILARLYLQQKKYDKALQFATEIQTEYSPTMNTGTGVYTSTSNTEIIWNISTPLPDASFKKVFTKGTFLPVIRNSELHLIIAEASLERGELANAESAINTVRTRAGLGTISSSDALVLRTAARDEWQREMKNEGVRFAALIRWDYTANTLGPLGFQGYHKNLPIPVSVLNLGPNLYQNVGYQ